MAGGTVSRTAHFVLHRVPLDAPSAPPGPGSERPQGLFAVRDEPWIGVVVPKRWAKRAVTRNGMKRQVYAVSESFASRLPAAAHVVRLRSDFARAQFTSAWSEPLKAAVRGELQRLFAQYVAPAKASAAARAQAVVPAQAGTEAQAPSVIPAQARIQDKP